MTSSRVFVLHEVVEERCAVNNNILLGVFQTFHDAHVTMMRVVQSLLYGVKGTAFLPSMRFQRVVIEPENRLRWEDTWQEYQTLPHYTITALPLNAYMHPCAHKVSFYDPDLHIKNTIIRNGWNDRDTQSRLENISKHVYFPSGDQWERMSSKDVQLGEMDKIHAWIARKEC